MMELHDFIIGGVALLALALAVNAQRMAMFLQQEWFNGGAKARKSQDGD